MEYLIIEFCVLIVAVFFHIFCRLQLFKNIWQGILIFASVLIFGGIWDNYAVYKGHWFYPGKGLVGLFIFNIPLEDYLFIIIVTYIILVGFAFAKKYIKNRKGKRIRG